MISEKDAYPVSMRHMARKLGTRMQVRYLRWAALLCALRLNMDVASVVAVKAAHEGTLRSVSSKRLLAVT